MKTVIVAGTPGSGKTAVLVHTIKDLLQSGHSCAVVKFDCLYTDDDKRFEKLGIPVRVGLAKDMCPDHFAIYNYEEIVAWSSRLKSKILTSKRRGCATAALPIRKTASVYACWTRQQARIRRSSWDRSSLRRTSPS